MPESQAAAMSDAPALAAALGRPPFASVGAFGAGP
jgi:hypothetical protein